MKKQYFSTQRPKVYALICFISGLVLLFALVAVSVSLSLLFSLKFFLEILDEFIVFFIIAFFLVIACGNNSISFFRKKQMMVAEVDGNGMYYRTGCNRVKYIYFVEIKDIYLNVDKKVELLYKNGRILTVSMEITDDEKMEFISLVKKNLIKKSFK